VELGISKQKKERNNRKIAEEKEEEEDEDERVPDNMGIAREHPQNGNLAEGGGRNTFFVLMEASLLEGNDVPSGLFSCPVHLSVRSFSNLFKLLECLFRRQYSSCFLHFSSSPP